MKQRSADVAKERWLMGRHTTIECWNVAVSITSWGQEISTATSSSTPHTKIALYSKLSNASKLTSEKTEQLLLFLTAQSACSAKPLSVPYNVKILLSNPLLYPQLRLSKSTQSPSSAFLCPQKLGNRTNGAKWAGRTDVIEERSSKWSKKNSWKKKEENVIWQKLSTGVTTFNFYYKYRWWPPPPPQILLVPYFLLFSFTKQVWQNYTMAHYSTQNCCN